MKTFAPPHPAINRSSHLYYQSVCTSTDLLPSPLDCSPEVRRTRTHAAIAKVAALLPVNANKIDLAARSTATQARAEGMRVQAVRQRREAIDGAETRDARTRHVAEHSMLKVADPDIERVTSARPEAATATQENRRVAGKVS